MTILTRMGQAGRFSFGHLMTLPRGAKRAAEPENEPLDPEKEEREDGRRRTREEDQETDARKSRRAASPDPDDEEEDDAGERRETGGAEDEDENAGADPEEDEDDPDEEDEAENGEDEDDEEEMRRARAKGFGRALKTARRAERRRIGRILSSTHARGRIAVAAHLACNTALPANEAIGVLRHAPMTAAPRGVLAAAMLREPRPHIGPDGGPAAETPAARLQLAAERFARGIAGKRR